MPGLQIDEHLRFERSEWVAERIGWCATWLFMLLALAGMLGQGPIASTTRETPGMTLEYMRFTHVSQPMVYRLRLRPTGSESEVVISGGLLGAIEISSVLPEPREQRARADGALALIFQNPTGSTELGVTIHAAATSPGKHTGRLEYAGNTIDLWQFAYP